MDSNMTKRNKIKKKRIYYNQKYCYVVLRLWARDLNPEQITKKLGIVPDSSWIRGPIRDKNGNIIKRKDGTLSKRRYGQWNLDAHVHDNSGLEARIKSILEQIRPKKIILEQLLKNLNADLKIVVHPNEHLSIASYLFSGKLLNEFTSLGIDIQFTIELPVRPEKTKNYVRKINKEN